MKKKSTKTKPYKSALFVLCEDFLEEIVKLWDGLPQSSLLAALLDPRFKTLYFMDPTNKVESWKALQDRYIESLFNFVLLR